MAGFYGIISKSSINNEGNEITASCVDNDECHTVCCENIVLIKISELYYGRLRIKCHTYYTLQLEE